MSTELSSSEIARELYTSQNTVRTHIRNIYGKLDVHARDARSSAPGNSA